MVKTANELQSELTTESVFYVETYITDDCFVGEIFSDVPEDIPHISFSDDSWSFTGDDGDTEWFFVVDPDRGGPNNGVVYCFWFTNEEIGGHHEVYPRAIGFVE